MIACVDADYDYLLQDTNYTSRLINHSPYIFHTYVYAIENYQCYAESLHSVCVMATLNDHRIIDLESFLTEFSKIIWPLFVWSIWAYRNNFYRDFTMTEFGNIVSFSEINVYHPEHTLEAIRKRVNRKIGYLQNHFPQAKGAYEPLKEELIKLGVTPETTYLYVQGHHLFDKVVVPMLKKICNMLVRERENEISRQSVHPTQRNNELSCYSGSVADVELMLKKNIAFTSSAPCGRMMDDIRRFLGDEPSVDTERREYAANNVPGKDGATAAETHTDGV